MEEKPKSIKKRPDYFAVFMVLAVLTAIEVTVAQLPLPRALILIPLSLIKAGLVALFYMHLRSDRRVFRVVFVIGLLVALSLIVSFTLLLNNPANIQGM